MVSSRMRSVYETSSLTTTESGLVLASSALRAGTFTKEELTAYGQEFVHWRGTRKARLAIRLADHRLETVGEARSFHMFWRHGLPYPELQYSVLDENGQFVGRTDFCWCGYRHVGEFDGLVKYGRLNPYITDIGRVITDEKIREDLIRPRVRDVAVGLERSGPQRARPDGQTYRRADAAVQEAVPAQRDPHPAELTPLASPVGRRRRPTAATIVPPQEPSCGRNQLAAGPR